MNRKPKFLVLPNGGIVRKNTVVAIKARNRIELPGDKWCPPGVVVLFLIGGKEDYLYCDCTNNEEREALISVLYKELEQ